MNLTNFATGKNFYEDQAVVVKNTRLVQFIIFTSEHETKANTIQFEGDITLKDLQFVIEDILEKCDIENVETSGTINVSQSDVLSIMNKVNADCDVFSFISAVETLQAKKAVAMMS